MRVRFAIVPVVIAAVSLTACSSSSKSTGGSSTNSASSSNSSTSAPASSGGSGSGSASQAAFCTDLKTFPQKEQEIIAKASDPAGLKALLMSESPFLAKLKAEAPANGSTIVASLESLFQQAQTALSGTPNAAALAALATKLPDTAKQAADYVVANCK